MRNNRIAGCLRKGTPDYGIRDNTGKGLNHELTDNAVRNGHCPKAKDIRPQDA